MTKTQSPGLLKVARKNGKTDYYWRADRAVKGNPRVKEYPDQSINLNSVSAADRPSRCQKEKNRLLDWLANGKPNPLRFDGTIASLAKIYEIHPDSPIRDVRHGTRVSYLNEAKILVKAVGKRRIDQVNGVDVRRWHRKASAPKEKGGNPRLRRGQGLVRHLRRIVKFGASLKLPECSEFKDILSDLRITTPPPREEAPELRHVLAIIEQAHKVGRPSIALAQAIMFELTIRQSNVIGQWEPIANGETESGIVSNGQRWGDGLLWQHISNGILKLKTSKTGKTGRWQIDEYPILKAEIDKVAIEKRTGPMIIDENAGRPYFHRHFARNFREIARLAGVPDEIWSRDFRAGGITESFDAGADLPQTQTLAQHTDPKMTIRYNRGSVIQTTSVARNRTSLRAHQKQTEYKV
jgi:hypothetical protein